MLEVALSIALSDDPKVPRNSRGDPLVVVHHSAVEWALANTPDPEWRSKGHPKTLMEVFADEHLTD